MLGAGRFGTIHRIGGRIDARYGLGGLGIRARLCLCGRFVLGYSIATARRLQCRDLFAQPLELGLEFVIAQDALALIFWYDSLSALASKECEAAIGTT